MTVADRKGLSIAILVLAFPPRWLAGTELATHNLARNLAQRGYDIDVITPLDSGLLRESLEHGFHVHRVPAPRTRALRTVFYWVRALLLLRRIKPDVVQAQGIDVGTCALLAKRLLRRPYVVWGRGSDIYRLSWFGGLLARSVLKEAGAAIALTQDMKREMQRVCDRGVFVIPNAIDLERFEGVSGVKTDLGLPTGADCRIIMFAGTLRRIKGVEYLIQAMRTVANEDRRARLVLVGDGEERRGLEELTARLDLKDVVTFAGRVPAEKVAEYMAASDIFVLPSLSEGFPGVVLEAMASGLPVIATRVTGLPEIVQHGENGFLVEPRKPGEIAEKVVLLLKDDTLRKRMGQDSRRRAGQYSWGEVARQLQTVYAAVDETKRGQKTRPSEVANTSGTSGQRIVR